MVELFYQLEVPVNVRDKGKAKKWYAHMLGIHFNERDRAEVAGATMVLFQFPDFRPASHVIYQFVTADLQEARQILLERGLDAPDIDVDNWNLVIADPDGNKIVLYEPRGYWGAGLSRSQRQH